VPVSIPEELDIHTIYNTIQEYYNIIAEMEKIKVSTFSHRDIIMPIANNIEQICARLCIGISIPWSPLNYEKHLNANKKRLEEFANKLEHETKIKNEIHHTYIKLVSETIDSLFDVMNEFIQNYHYANIANKIGRQLSKVEDWQNQFLVFQSETDINNDDATIFGLYSRELSRILYISDENFEYDLIKTSHLFDYQIKNTIKMDDIRLKRSLIKIENKIDKNKEILIDFFGNRIFIDHWSKKFDTEGIYTTDQYTILDQHGLVLIDRCYAHHELETDILFIVGSTIGIYCLSKRKWLVRDDFRSQDSRIICGITDIIKTNGLICYIKSKNESETQIQYKVIDHDGNEVFEFECDGSRTYTCDGKKHAYLTSFIYPIIDNCMVEVEVRFKQENIINNNEFCRIQMEVYHGIDEHKNFDIILTSKPLSILHTKESFKNIYYFNEYRYNLNKQYP
jgi:hypothetical protein